MHDPYYDYCFISVKDEHCWSPLDFYPVGLWSSGSHHTSLRRMYICSPKYDNCYEESNNVNDLCWMAGFDTPVQGPLSHVYWNLSDHRYFNDCEPVDYADVYSSSLSCSQTPYYLPMTKAVLEYANRRLRYDNTKWPLLFNILYALSLL